MIDLQPPLILPKHWVAKRPALIRSEVDPARYFPVEIDRPVLAALVSDLSKAGRVHPSMLPGMVATIARARRWTNMWLPASAPQNDTWGSYFARSKIAPSAFLAGASTTVRVTFIAATTGSFTIRNAWIGNSGGGAVNFDGGQVRITFGGANGITISAGQTLVSDPTTFAFNPATNKVVHVSFNSANAVTYQTGTFQAYWKAGDDDGTTNPASMSASFYALSSYGFSKIEVII